MYLEETLPIRCTRQVNPFLGPIGYGTGNCSASRRVDAAEPDGGLYRFAVTWTPSSEAWSEVRASLYSWDCSGGGGCLLAEFKVAVGGSPLGVENPTDGPETRVDFLLRPTAPIVVLSPQRVRVWLGHV